MPAWFTRFVDKVFYTDLTLNIPEHIERGTATLLNVKGQFARNAWEVSLVKRVTDFRGTSRGTMLPLFDTVKTIAAPNNAPSFTNEQIIAYVCDVQDQSSSVMEHRRINDFIAASRVCGYKGPIPPLRRETTRPGLQYT